MGLAWLVYSKSENLLAKLRPFTGTVLADAEHRFNALHETGRVLEAGCNDHSRRKFRDAESAQPTLAVEGGAFIGAMYGQEEPHSSGPNDQR